MAGLGVGWLVNIAFKPGSGEKQTLEYLKRFDDAVWQVNKEIKKEHIRRNN
jgi:hypothetical protein